MTEQNHTEHAAHRVNNAVAVAEASTPQRIGFMRRIDVAQDFDHMGAETIATLCAPRPQYPL